jgi:hypothetical protein
MLEGIATTIQIVLGVLKLNDEFRKRFKAKRHKAAAQKPVRKTTRRIPTKLVVRKKPPRKK